MIPALAKRFSVAAMDMRGYGDSAKPPDEASYDKRTVAEDALALARHLGWDNFLVAGHDRGARVTRRLAADHPKALWELFCWTSCPWNGFTVTLLGTGTGTFSLSEV